MFTAVALMCAMENPTSCGVITNGNFFTTEDACMGDIIKAVKYADTQGSFIRDFKCIQWSEPL
jgi:hypothetical protein